MKYFQSRAILGKQGNFQDQTLFPNEKLASFSLIQERRISFGYPLSMSRFFILSSIKDCNKANFSSFWAEGIPTDV